jgi:RNA polymerase sigma-70 factor (ECF subfamily)
MGDDEMVPEAPRMTPDRALVEAVAHDGDETAFRELYRRHTPRLYPLVLRIVGGAEMDAEDVVQEAWMRAVAGMSRFRGDSSFSTWLCAIGLNAARDHLRRRGKWNATEDVTEMEIAAPPTSHGQRMDLERAIAALPPGCRTVLVLHDVEGFTHEEIARRLGIAVGTSKSQLFAARRAARTLLGGNKEMTHARP